MSGRFVRASSYRHVHGTPAKSEAQFTSIRPLCSGDGNYIAGNGKFFATAIVGGGGPVLVHPMNKPGRLDLNTPKLAVHKNKVLDYVFNPFMSNMIATGGEDCLAKVTVFPEEGLTENIENADVTLEGHQKKVSQLAFHPTAANILGTVSHDHTMKIWDIETQAEALSFDDFADTIFHFDWNRNGSQVATISKDHMVRIFDPREGKSVQEAKGFEGTKKSSCLWTKQGKVFCVGFSRTSVRQFKIFDPCNFDQPLVTKDLDQTAGVLMPFYDHDTSILFLGGKGDSSIKYFEIVDQAPYAHSLSVFSDTQSQKGLGWLPKRACDVHKCEIAVCLRLMKDAVVPVSFQVPRKSDLFQKDIFPDTYAGISALTAQEWLGGENKDPVLSSMKPGEEAAEAKSTFTAQKSPAELRKELAEAHARIAELEAEVAALKAS
jgi:coronin-1B/1C/6